MEGLEGYFTPSNPSPFHLKNLPNKVIDPLPSPSLYSPLIPLHPNIALDSNGEFISKLMSMLSNHDQKNYVEIEL
jgi:hypothetical protein